MYDMGEEQTVVVWLHTPQQAGVPGQMGRCVTVKRPCCTCTYGIDTRLHSIAACFATLKLLQASGSVPCYWVLGPMHAQLYDKGVLEQGLCLHGLVLLPR